MKKAAIYLLNAWLIAVTLLAIHAVMPSSGESKPVKKPKRQQYAPATASYYTLFGNRTSCGKTASNQAWFVASLKADTAKCGLKVRICKRGTRRCVNVTVQDRGTWRHDNRRWDLQPRVKRALRCGDLCAVRWKHGW